MTDRAEYREGRMKKQVEDWWKEPEVEAPEAAGISPEMVHEGFLKSEAIQILGWQRTFCIMGQQVDGRSK